MKIKFKLNRKDAEALIDFLSTVDGAHNRLNFQENREAQNVSGSLYKARDAIENILWETL